jgi:branched-chain amino acid transport system permease protein
MYLLYRTKQGRAFRAIAQNMFVARLTGIPILRTSIYSYAMAGLLGGITAVFLAMSIGMASARLGDVLTVKVMTVMIFAGLGNLRGGIICAFIIGLVEGFVMGYLPGMWTDAVAFGVMIIGIIIRPEGVFGSRA